jgi:hypothetical protein
MLWKIKPGPTMTVVTMTFAVMAVLVPSARPDDGPKKGASTCVVQEKGGTDNIGAGCQDSQNNGAAQESIEKEKGKKRNLFRAWLDLGERVQAMQPDWLSPLATTSGRLKQEFRYDIWDQPATGGNRNYQFGGSKGLEFITSSRTQILIGVPTYTLVSPSGPPGGFGDLPDVEIPHCFGRAHGRQLSGDLFVGRNRADRFASIWGRRCGVDANDGLRQRLEAIRRAVDPGRQSPCRRHGQVGYTAALEHRVPISGCMETLARTGSQLHVLHHTQICRRDPTVPDTWPWNWTRAPCGTISAIGCGGHANRGDPVPYLQSSLDVFDARLVLI